MKLKKFRTIELSEAVYEADGLRFMTVKSTHLMGRGDICVFVPEGMSEAKNLPIHILLHGVYGSAWIWALKGGVHKTAAKMIASKKISPCIIAMPSDGLWGDGSAYKKHSKRSFDRWIVDDVVSAIRQYIPQASDNSKVCLGGLSMGGYGALRLGVLYSEVFTAISAHSSITKLAQMENFVEEDTARLTSISDIPDDLIDVFKSRAKKNIPPFRFDCGKDDDLFLPNQALSQALKELNILHVFEAFNGGHEWSYWREHVEKTLLFFDKQQK